MLRISINLNKSPKTEEINFKKKRNCHFLTTPNIDNKYHTTGDSFARFFQDSSKKNCKNSKKNVKMSNKYGQNYKNSSIIENLVKNIKFGQKYKIWSKI